MIKGGFPNWHAIHPFHIVPASWWCGNRYVAACIPLPAIQWIISFACTQEHERHSLCTSNYSPRLLHSTFPFHFTDLESSRKSGSIIIIIILLCIYPASVHVERQINSCEPELRKFSLVLCPFVVFFSSLFSGTHSLGSDDPFRGKSL